MATTSPDNIWTPDSGDNYALTTDLAATADSIQDAISGLRLNGATGLIGTTANRPAAGVKGRTFYATDTDILWFDDGGTWKNRTPGIVGHFTSGTSLINGTVTLSWSDASTTYVVDTGGFYNPGQPTRVTVPYTGSYEVFHTTRSNGVAPITTLPIVNGNTGSPLTYGYASGFGTGGAASMAARGFVVNLSAGDYLSFNAQSTASGSGTHSLVIKFLGEF